MKTPVAVMLVFLMGTLFGGSSPADLNQSQWKGKVVWEDGIRVVKNPQEPIWNKNICEIKAELTIGEAEGAEEYMFQRIGVIAVDNEERIYISDWKESRIKVYNQKGVYLRTIGRKGQGPGEFEGITGIQILPENEIVVYDSRIRRLSFFCQDGSLIKSLSIHDIPALDLRMNAAGGYVASTLFLDPNTARAVTSIGIYDSDLRLVKTIAVSEPEDVQTPFLPFLVWTTLNDDLILFGFNKNYKLQILAPDGQMIKKIENDYTPVKITDEERKERLKRLQQPDNKDVPKYHPAFRSVTSDEDGRLFVQTWVKSKNSEGYIYNVHDKDGRFLAELVLKFPPRIWKNNKLYCVEEDADGYQSVKRYQVTWNH